jgi:hypothetical protein
MIRALIRWLFAKDFAAEKKAVVGAAKDVLSEARKAQVVHYVNYERVDPRSEFFLQGMQPACDSKFVVSWLNEHKNQAIALMARSMVANDSEKVLRGMAQVMLIDSLLMDLESFGEKFRELLDQREEFARQGTGE